MDERKTFWGWMYAQQCFTDVESACEALANPQFKAVEKHLICAVIVTYAKPFTRWSGLERKDASGKDVYKFLNDLVIPKEYKTVHANLIDLRHKVFAHIDAQNFRADDPGVGNINQVRLKMSNGELWTSIVHPGRVFKADKVRELARILRTKADYHTEKFIEKYKPHRRLRDGNYVLNLDDSKPEAFVQVDERVTSLYW